MPRRSILYVQQILKWADTYFRKTRRWPKQATGRVFTAPDEKWFNIDQCLLKGYRGLPRGWSLAQLLNEYRVGRLGGPKGGKARAIKLTSKRRSEIAKAAAKSRWVSRKQTQVLQISRLNNIQTFRLIF